MAKADFGNGSEVLRVVKVGRWWQKPVKHNESYLLMALLLTIKKLK